MKEIIKVKNLSYSVKDGLEEKLLLKDINVSFAASEIITISCPSGSGKTTFLYALAGLLDDLSGEVFIDGTDIINCSKKEREYIRLYSISLVFQNLNLLEFMNVEDNILIPFYVKNKDINDLTYSRMNEYLEIMNLGNIKKRRISSLSGGEQQRVAIVRSILDEPKIILCDEPTASLDKKNAEIFMRTVEEIARKSKAAIIIVTHDEHVMKYGDSKFHMEDGMLERVS